MTSETTANSTPRTIAPGILVRCMSDDLIIERLTLESDSFVISRVHAIQLRTLMRNVRR